MELWIELVKTLGVPVAFAGLTSWFILYRDRRHEAERKDWRIDDKERHSEFVRVVERSNDIMSENTTTLKLLAERHRQGD